MTLMWEREAKAWVAMLAKRRVHKWDQMVPSVDTSSKQDATQTHVSRDQAAVVGA